MHNHFGITIESAEILTIGTEILMGQIVNTNASYYARQLSDLGISSYFQVSCGDNPERLKACLRQALERSDCVLLSGGLGPTADDISMACAAEVAGVELQMNDYEADKISSYFERLGRTATASNYKQALLPVSGQVIVNNNGTAPGAIMEFMYKGEKRSIILLPGPPNENRPMFREQVKDYLMQTISYRIKNIFIRLIGIGESSAEAQVKDLIDGQDNPSLAPYASTGEVMFRITEKYRNGEEPHLAQQMLDAFKQKLGDYIYEIGERKMPQVVADLCTSQGLTLALAESCTSGLMSAEIGELAGASQYFLGSIVTYSNEAKVRELGVSENIIQTEGAVSAIAAETMAQNCRSKFSADYACAITGVAGPSGGTPEKPVGTVFVAVASENSCVVKKYLFNGDRPKIQQQAALNALNQLRLSILKDFSVI